MTKHLRRALWLLALALLSGLSVTAHARGQKFAVVVGINNAPDKPALESSEDDANKMFQLLTKRGFNDITLLRGARATRANIWQALNNALDKAGPGDLFVFYFSGHGTLFDDEKSLFRDESISYTRPDQTIGFSDSALVPYDSADGQDERAWGNLILDDELFNLFADFAAKSCYVMLIADACNSGSLSKGDFSLSDEAPPEPSPVAKGLPLTMALDGLGRLNSWPVTPYCNEQEKTMPGGYYLALTASADDQEALELPIGTNYKKRRSLFTYWLLEEADKTAHTYASLYNEVFRLTKRDAQGRQRQQAPKLDVRFGRGNWLDTPFLDIPDHRPAATVRPRQCVELALTAVAQSTGQPLADCFIEIFSTANVIKGRQTPLLSGRTDTRGVFISDTDLAALPPGRYRFQVSHSDYRTYNAAATVTANNSGRFTFEIQLTRKTHPRGKDW